MSTSDWNRIPAQLRHDLWLFAEELALAGGQKSLEFFAKDIGVEWKTDQSPVTIADRETELSMRQMIAERYPDHAIHGEEYGAAPHKEFTWVLDPIDGTKSFISGVPLYCTLAALLYQGTPVIGVIVNPPSGELVSGCMNSGTRDASGDPVRVSASPAPQLRLYTSDYEGLRAAEPDWLQPLKDTYGPGRTVARTWGDAYGYMLVATGRGEIMLDPELKLWDVAPLHPILHEAGGILCDIQGTPATLPRSATAMSRELHQQIFG
ncbi:inositol monophosphatase family protein [Spirochaeta africana]|uniref:Inositol monophosphatase/fructose-1,6-bisphosphatase family protein n=1 Tax=Spirochaeta africana (strain ATCC 700263 / DSM 8902 / Z-7692) TaxID=889378 RepID=H9UJC5_SPIAZ|nr:inositol monophosphatase family protein [Spirochaeta africana]AFG37618.1 inositol monophosphatase/fructose-1,6-bisphosphatase family protein [Spirochaeta africana DSM 8902]